MLRLIFQSHRDSLRVKEKKKYCRRKPKLSFGMLCNLEIGWLIVGAIVSHFVGASPVFRPPKPIFPPKPGLLSG